MKLALAKSSTSQTALIFVQDSSSSTGGGLTGLVYNSAGLSWYYYREAQGTGGTSVTLATMTLGTWATGGFVEVDATNMPGWYEIGIPDAALASGADFVGMMLKGATNMAPVALEIQLTDVDLNDGVRAGLTALPNAAADAAGGLPISDAGGLDMDAILADTNELQSDDVPGLIAALNDPTAATIAGAVWDEATSGHVTAGTYGVAATDILADTNELQADWANGGRLDLILDARASQASVDTVDAIVDAILLDTGTDGVVVASHTTAALAEIEAEAEDALQLTVPDSVPSDGSRPSVQQALYMIVQYLTEFAISGTTYTVKKPDGSTTLMTFTLDDASSPTSITRAT